MLSADSREILKQVSTATLTTVLFKRGLRNQYIQGIFRLNPKAPRMVGEAWTLRFIPAREDLDHIGVFDGRGHPQREAVEAIPAGHVMVMDTGRETRCASAGGILVTRMKVRGAAGYVTDGGLRDSPELEGSELPIYIGARSAPLNLVHLHAAEANVPIGCGGVAVYPGDIMVGDNEGVVVVPSAIAAEVAAEAVSQTEMEDYVEMRVREGAGIFGLYPPNAETKAAFEAWKKSRRK
jgi:regulator of RNase E activity RraA